MLTCCCASATARSRARRSRPRRGFAPSSPRSPASTASTWRPRPNAAWSSPMRRPTRTSSAWPKSTVLMIVAALYDLNDAQDRLRRSLPRPDPLRARQIRGKTIGFIGLGKIGREAARLLAPWGATMQYSARRDADLAGLPPMRARRARRASAHQRRRRGAGEPQRRDARSPERRKAPADEEDRGAGQHGARRDRRRAGADRRAPGRHDRGRRARCASRSSRCRPTARCGR